MSAQQVLNTSWVPEIFADKNGRVDVGSINAFVAGGSANASVISAITGKRIVVLSAVLASGGAATSIRFKSASGGTQILFATVPANTAATPNVILGPCQWGVFLTNAGEALVADTGAVGVDVSLTYLAYTP